MAIYKNVASQKVAVFAVDSAGDAQTGDAANISAQISKDGGACAATNDTNPTELDSTDAPGYYIFDLTQAETNADMIILSPSSSTSGVGVFGLVIYTEPEARDISASGVDDIWDEVLTGGTHNVASSAGRRLRNLQDFGVYEGGAIWIDTVNGVAGTTDYENGTVNNPVDTIADALTLAASVGLSRLQVLPGSSITLGASVDNYEFRGHGYTIALNGQSVSGTAFYDATITGNDDGTNGTATVYSGCIMGNNTLGKHLLHSCRFTGDMVLAEAADYFWDQCFSGVAGTGTPSVDLESAAETKNLSIRHYSGGIEFKNFGAGGGTHTASVEGHGQVVLNANCAGGTVAIRGNLTVTDNAGGAVTLSDDARIDVDQVADSVWDELQSGHTTAGTFGKYLDTEVSGVGGGGTGGGDSGLYLIAKYGEALSFTAPIPKTGSTDFAASGDWTPAEGDVKISKDGGNVANIATLPTAVGGSGSLLWSFSLSATEMSAATVTIQISDAALQDHAITIHTYGHASAQITRDYGSVLARIPGSTLL